MKTRIWLVAGIIMIFLLNGNSSSYAQVGSIAQANVQKKLPMETLKVSPGFQLSIYANNVPEARQLAVGDKGTVFVGSLKSGNVYALVDKDQDSVADERITIATGLKQPAGVAFKDGTLYIAAIDQIVRMDKIEENLKLPGQPVLVTNDLPKDEWNGLKYIKFGPDGKLYVSIGSPCNACVKEEDERYGTIMRMDTDGKNAEIVAKGIRYSLGFDWQPETNELYFSDIGRDLLGDDSPPEELNGVTKEGMHFGFPYCHGKAVSDPEFGSEHKCEEFTGPKYELAPRVMPMGIHFYRSNKFPESFTGRLFVAEHGSWDRPQKVGSALGVARFKSYDRTSYANLAFGWIIENESWGQPVDVVELPDGSMLMSEDQLGTIYRLGF